MNNYDDFYEAIDEIKDCLKKELFGCSSENEIFESEEPISAYATGILYPIKKTNNIESEAHTEEESYAGDDFEIDDTIETGDDTIMAANKYKPSSMGISVMIPPETETLNVRFEFGVYRHYTEELLTENGAEPKKINKYERIPKLINVEFDVPNRCVTVVKKYNEEGYDKGAYNINLYFTVRKIMPDKSKLVTISVANRSRHESRLHTRTEKALFQCKITIESLQGFLPVYANTAIDSDIESQIRKLLYRDIKNYGYGHGCSISYDETADVVFKIYSDFMPSRQVLQMTPGEIKNDDILYLSKWKNISRSTACEKLKKFISEYREWRDNAKQEAENITDFGAAPRELIKRVEICIERLENGVEVLKNNDDAWRSFQLMNEAMLLQRKNTKHQKEDTIKWYPFQLAYILMIIPDIVNEKSNYRDCVDLLWFPTGGGKTEAYLGVAAFVIFYRRISKRIEDDGVAIIMRYTLRLLTIQQFERATALICACEYLRRSYNICGGEISIGLWIGSGMTPNHISDAGEVLERLRKNTNEKIYEGNPVQITTCPWCGAEIDVTGYSIEGGSMVIRCRDNPNCEFHHKLPVYVVDDDIYKNRPTLLLSTIDKFARIAWVSDAKRLFGIGNIPPSLIIQDELHLISGSLGSLAGLYEIAIEYLCMKDNIYPKVIASTATVRNADEQIANLYNKSMFQFPPSGLSYKDSFFAHIADKNQRPARTYIGLCESGGSMIDLLIRIYAVLTYIKTLFLKQGKDREVIDQYYTIVGYFNAIRDLGSSSNILNDRMYTNVRSLIKHKFKVLSDEYNINMDDITKLYNEELTSRKTAKEIKETLTNLENRYDEPGCYAYVLASNMLSVGIDINRLGLMTMYCQPKTNAEYIQATSRVGRKYPGLVIAMYNPMRSRDKSHYEQFGFYHDTFYQYVEATSVTPFSIGAMEKALHCIFIAMVRLSIPELNKSPVTFRGSDIRVQKIKNYILDNIAKLSPKTADIAEYFLNELISAWENIIQEYDDLCYESNKKGQISLLNSGENPLSEQFPTILNSLRNVEKAVNIYIEK